MYRLFIFITILFLKSCTVTRNIKIESKTEEDLISFYKAKEINNFLIIKDYNSLLKLNENDRMTIPQNIIFDESGFEIEHFDNKLCANHTLEFLKKFNSETSLKKTEYNIENYISNFKSINDSINIDSILKERKIRIFVNSATYGETLKYIKANDEAFEIYRQFKNQYLVYIVNLDIRNWDSK